MNNELNIGTINGLTVENILDKMVEKGIGISGGGSSGGDLPFDPASISVGKIIPLFGGTEWRAVHKTSQYLYLATTHILGFSVFGENNTYAQSQLKQYARQFTDIFTDYEKRHLIANPNTGDLVSPMSYEQINGGFSYFNSNSKRVCESQPYWTHSPFGSGVWRVNADGNLHSDANPSTSRGFRPFCCVSL